MTTSNYFCHDDPHDIFTGLIASELNAAITHAIEAELSVQDTETWHAADTVLDEIHAALGSIACDAIEDRSIRAHTERQIAEARGLITDTQLRLAREYR